MLCLLRDDEDLVAARRQLEAAGAFVVDALRRDGSLGRRAQGGGRRRLDAGHVAHVDEEFVAIVAVAAHEVQDGTGLFQIQILTGGDMQVVGAAAERDPGLGKVFQSRHGGSCGNVFCWAQDAMIEN